MKLRKHLGAKVAALGASLIALVSTLVLVHRNPPASADSAPSATPTTSSAPLRRSLNRFGTGSTQQVPTTHTRTHAS